MDPQSTKGMQRNTLMRAANVVFFSSTFVQQFKEMPKDFWTDVKLVYNDFEEDNDKDSGHLVDKRLAIVNESKDSHIKELLEGNSITDLVYQKQINLLFKLHHSTKDSTISLDPIDRASKKDMKKWAWQLMVSMEEHANEIKEQLKEANLQAKEAQELNLTIKLAKCLGDNNLLHALLEGKT